MNTLSGFGLFSSNGIKLAPIDLKFAFFKIILLLRISKDYEREVILLMQWFSKNAGELDLDNFT